MNRVSIEENNLRGSGNYLKFREAGLGTGPFEIRCPFLESPDNFSGPESYFKSAKFTLRFKFCRFLS